MQTRNIISVLALAAVISSVAAAGDEEAFARARENGRRYDQMAAACQRLLKAWVAYADPRTLLLPDRLPILNDFPEWYTSDMQKKGERPRFRLYTPHNSGADLYPYLILTAHLTDPDLYHGRMMEMLRNEIRFTTAQESIPANLDLDTGQLGPPSLFSAGEYAKDGLVPVTERLGRTPWFYRMVDMVSDAMNRAPVPSRFGNLPASDGELNGDYLQALFRLASMTGERRFFEWLHRIGDAYIEEVLPGNHGVPASTWDFDKHAAGDGRLRLADHGNETAVGLTLLYALEQSRQTPRAARYRPAIARMLDRILESANPDGLLYTAVDAATLKPFLGRDGEARLTDNWGYLYCAVYAFYQCTGEAKYRDAVRRVLKNLPKYRNFDWQNGSFDGYADSIEGAIYLAAREPVPEALGWIESEIQLLAGMQKPSGLMGYRGVIEHLYGEGNFNRTLMLYMDYKSQGCHPERWRPGLRLGAVRLGERLYLSLEAAGETRVHFDFARHRRVLNLDKNYVRLNEFPEWYTVDENTLYTLRPVSGTARVRLGSELIAGVPLEPGNWTVEPAGKAPYGPAQKK